MDVPYFTLLDDGSAPVTPVARPPARRGLREAPRIASRRRPACRPL